MKSWEKIISFALFPFIIGSNGFYSSSFLIENHILRPEAWRSSSLDEINPLTILKKGTLLKAKKHILSSDTNEDNGKSTLQEYRSGSLMAATKEKGRVPYGEESRKYRRTIYNYDDWIRHRSNERLAATLSGLFFSGIVRQLAQKVGSVSAVATFVVLWNYIALSSSIPFNAPHAHLPVAPFQLASSALGLLLVFRTNASYQRWLEARKAWGKIISQSRNMIRMTCTFVDDTQPTTQDRLKYLSLSLWLYSRSIMNKLSGSADEVPYIDAVEKSFMSMEDMMSVDKNLFLTQVITSPDRSVATLMELSLALNNVPIDEKRRVEIDKSLVIISDQQSECERIFSSPVPLVYTRHTARFLSFYVLTLPFALYDQFRAAGDLIFASCCLVPASAILSLFLFGIEELAVQLEEPFSILPMEEFCNKINEASEIMLGWRFNRKKETSK